MKRVLITTLLLGVMATHQTMAETLRICPQQVAADEKRLSEGTWTAELQDVVNAGRATCSAIAAADAPTGRGQRTEVLMPTNDGYGARVVAYHYALADNLVLIQVAQ
jgi:hypothetical protein